MLEPAFAPALTQMFALLERILPGRSPAVQKLRRELVEFSSSLTAKTVLLHGPIGAGKSTIGRSIGLLRRIAPLTEAAARRYVEDAKFDGPNRIDIRSIPWYVELSLTGLVDSLAETQLFGVVKGGFTGATAQRMGIFEQASRGRVPRGEIPRGAELTGGVVFLDEIGDLTPVLQAKLLPVLSEAPFYRVGGEGDPSHQLEYRGVTVTASWKQLESGRLRADLLSRLAAHRIRVPGLDEREQDFRIIFDEVQRVMLKSVRAAIDRVLIVDPEADGVYWRRLKDSLQPVSEPVRRRLEGVNWAAHANLRGLTAALERIIVNNADVEEVVAQLPAMDDADDSLSDDAPALVTRLMRRTGDGQGLAGHLRAIEVEQRRALREALLDDLSTRRRLALSLGLDQEQLLSQIHQLDRRRRQVPRPGHE